MSDQDDLHIQLMLTEPRIAKLTEAAVGEALVGFPLQPKQGMAWLARAIQGALYVSLGNASDGPERQSNADTRDELEKLATRASAIWLDIAERSHEADDALWSFAFGRWDGTGGKEIDGITIGEPLDYRAFTDALAQLDWLSSFLRNASKQVTPQNGPWRQSERREQRIWRAQCLSPVYELAFDAEASVNSWPGAHGGPWRDFYQRIVALAFDENATPDWEGVLDEARRRHKAERVTFAAGVVPDNPP